MLWSSEVLCVATREIGYSELPGHINKYGEWFGWNGVPWCMEFVQWVYHTAGMDLPYKTASCGALLRWYENEQPECITDKPIPGCVCIFDFPNNKIETDHTGIFVRSENGKITSIDGNTSGGNDSNGGWVQQRTRKLNYANPTYIVPRGLVDMTIDKFISEMTDEQAYKIYCKAERHMNTLPLPTNWDAATELREAMTMGITDGSNPMIPTPRYQAAIMVKRAVKNVLKI